MKKSPQIHIINTSRVSTDTTQDMRQFINTSIICAAEKWIVFTEETPTATLLNKMEHLVKRHEFAKVIAGNSLINPLGNAVLRDLSHSLPIIYSRDYFAEFLPINDLKTEQLVIVKRAYKNGGLILDSDYIDDNKRYNARLFRPVLHIVKNRLFHKTKDPDEPYTPKDISELLHDPSIPVFINCRDRLEPLKKLVSWLESEGLTNIIFIDNKSTYEPLLKYYKNTQYKVIKLGQNMGQRAPWASGAINYYAKNMPFIVTDPDVLPCENSHGAVNKFIEILNRYKELAKVGFGLRIDNLPDYYEPKQNVIKWESAFWSNELDKNIYSADLDTTFAVYRPNTPYVIRPAARTGGRFVAEHEPWYENSKKPSQEMLYYRNHANKDIGSWGITEDDISTVYKQP